MLKIMPMATVKNNSLMSFGSNSKWAGWRKSYSEKKVNYLNDYTLTRLNKLLTSSTMIPTYLKINRFYDLDLIFGKVFNVRRFHGPWTTVPGPTRYEWKLLSDEMPTIRFTEIRFRSKEDLHLGHFSEELFRFYFFQMSILNF